MKTIVFDLKGTLVDETGAMCEGVQETLEKVYSREGVQIIIYSMNEPWTYAALQSNALLTQVTKVMLVRKKIVMDLASIQASENNILVVGDGLTEELKFAKKLGIRSYDATNAFPADGIIEWMEKGND